MPREFGKKKSMYLKTKGGFWMFRAGYSSSPSKLPLHLVVVISTVAFVAQSVEYPPFSYLSDIKLFFSKLFFCVLFSELL